jgi:zinc transport system substrate-binding protein
MVCNTAVKERALEKRSWLVGVALVSFVAASALGCARPGTVDGKLSVVASFDAMAEFAKAVGGDKAAVTTLSPAGVEPHDFEPKAKDMVALGKAAVFVYNGLGMESWAEKAVAAAGNGRLVAVDASAGARPISNADPGKVEERGRYDPHLWLSLSGAALQAKNIAAALARADPRNASYYEGNGAAFVRKLDDLRAEYEAKFRFARGRGFVTGHAAFAYFCRDFGLEQASVEDVFAEGEPSAKGLAELVDYCRANKIKTVFVEGMVSPEVSMALASEVGAKVETIDTLEGPEGGKGYLERQRENLEKVYDSLLR